MKPHFSISQSKALRSKSRGYLFELGQATCSEKSLVFCSPFTPARFLAAASSLSRLLPLAQTKLPIPCYSIFLALAWIFFFTFLDLPGLSIPFLSSGRHLPLFPSIRWESLSTLLLPFSLSLLPPASQSFWNASIYLVYSSLFSLPARPVSPWTVCSRSNSVPLSIHFGWV